MLGTFLLGSAGLYSALKFLPNIVKSSAAKETLINATKGFPTRFRNFIPSLLPGIGPVITLSRTAKALHKLPGGIRAFRESGKMITSTLGGIERDIHRGLGKTGGALLGISESTRIGAKLAVSRTLGSSMSELKSPDELFNMVSGAIKGVVGDTTLPRGRLARNIVKTAVSGRQNALIAAYAAVNSRDLLTKKLISNTAAIAIPGIASLYTTNVAMHWIGNRVRRETRGY